MTRAEIETKVREIVGRSLDMATENVRLEDHLIEDLGGDSLSLVEMLLAAEEEFGVDVDDEEVDRVRTVRDAVDLVEQKLQAREAA